VALNVSTLADWVGASAATLMPLVEVIGAHVLAAERLHADDTTMPVLDTARSTCATTGCLPAAHRRQQSTSTHPIEAQCVQEAPSAVEWSAAGRCP